MKTVLVSLIALAALASSPFARANDACHANLVGYADGAKPQGKTSIVISFYAHGYAPGFGARWRSLYADSVHIAVTNTNLTGKEQIKVHWINGWTSGANDFNDGVTVDVIPLAYNADQLKFEGDLRLPASRYPEGLEIRGPRFGFEQKTELANQIAVEIDGTWLKDAYFQDVRHNFNFNLARALDAQGGFDASCYSNGY